MHDPCLSAGDPRAAASHAARRRARAGRLRLTLWMDAGLALVLAVAGGLWLARERGLIDPFVHVDDGAVGVLVDYAAAELRGPISPGYKGVLPLLQELWVLDRTPRELTMQGLQLEDSWHVPHLLVRARDGSRFSFERVSVQVELDTSMASEVLRDTSLDEARRASLVHVTARAVLGEEFGRFDAESVLLADRRHEAAERARERMAERLALHGILVLDVSLSRPSFDPRWEQTIERRKQAEQQIDDLEREAELLLAGEAAAQANSRRQLELQLEKDRYRWGLELEDLVLEGAQAQESRAQQLATLRREHELRMQQGRGQWAARSTAFESRLERLQAGLQPRLSALEEEAAAALAARRAQWQARAAELERALEEAPARAQLELAAARDAAGLEGAALSARLAAERAQAEQDVARQSAEAERAFADRVRAAEVGRDARLALALVLRERYAQEAQSFRAETEALARAGVSVVRAALIEGLASLRLDLVAPPPEAARGVARGEL